MNDVWKKIVLDIVVTPATVICGVLSACAIMLSPVVGSWSMFWGFAFGMLAVGSVFTNMIFNYSNIVQRAIGQVQKDQQAARDEQLDALDVKLLLDRDPRDQTALRNLRRVYDSFMADLRDGKITAAVPRTMLNSLNEMFDSCVRELERQHAVWDTSTKVAGKLKENLISERNELIEKIEKSVEWFVDFTGEIRALGLKSKDDDLERLQMRLACQLTVVRQLDRNEEDHRFDDYVKVADEAYGIERVPH